MSNAVRQRTALCTGLSSAARALLVLVLLGAWFTTTVANAPSARAATAAGPTVAGAAGPLACADRSAQGDCVGTGRSRPAYGHATAGSVPSGAAGSVARVEGGSASLAPGADPARAIPADLPAPGAGSRADSPDTLGLASVAVGMAAVAVVLLEVFRRRLWSTAPAVARTHHRSTRGGSRRASRL